MTKNDFLKKYPELDDNGDISKIKINLLTGYSTHFLSRKDNKIKGLLIDYNRYIVSEKRDIKIDSILIEKGLKRLKTTI